MKITNNDRCTLIIDGQIEEDKVWGGAYFAYQHLAYILQRGEAKKLVQVINVDTKDVIVSVDIKKVVKA